MSQMEYWVRQIPFFSNKNFLVCPCIYHNDAYPACLVVQGEGQKYKVRFPGVLNKNSVQSEKEALKLLVEYGIVEVPQIITEGVVDEIPYIVESYIEGSSLDKIHHKLLREDWEYIAHRIALFLQRLEVIQSPQPFVFKNPQKKYNNYGKIIKESILRHLEKHISLGIISLTAIERIQEMMEDIDSVFQADATFLHFDIKPQNIVFNFQNKQISFIDYEHSRMGDYTHELFRVDMAAVRNPYFNECWKLAKQEYLLGRSDCFCGNEYSRKSFYYELLYDISELTYCILVNDQKQISVHLNGIEDKLRQH